MREGRRACCVRRHDDDEEDEQRASAPELRRAERRAQGRWKRARGVRRLLRQHKGPQSDESAMQTTCCNGAKTEMMEQAIRRLLQARD
jgi:hypothetical protein